MEVFREPVLQSEDDYNQLKELRKYCEDGTGNALTKFDNFTKYVQKNALSRFLARYEIFKLQLSITGSILDLGIARGGSLMAWAQLSAMFEPVNYTREILGFDTFEGFPSVHKSDMKNESELIHKGGYKVEEDIYDDIKRAVDIYDLNRPLKHIQKVKLIKGDIMKTLPEYLDENPHTLVSLLHIDTDLYEPTKLALELLARRVPKGGVIVFDELNSKLYPGETVAMLETLGAHKLRIQRFPWATSIAYAVVE